MANRGRAAPVIFLSYRRADTDAVAGRLRDRMSRELPEIEVFFDVNSVAAGADIKAVITDKIARSSLVLALIGPKWLGESGNRLLEPEDLVRFEIATAFSHAKRIIPVLVNSTLMPAAKDMPDDVGGLRILNAVELRHSRFDDDFANLMRAVTGGGLPADRTWYRHWRPWLLSIAGGAAIGLVAAQIGLIVHYHATGSALSQRVGEDGALLVYPLFALAGALIAGWRDRRRRGRVAYGHGAG
jgi:hypothetical protein